MFPLISINTLCLGPSPFDAMVESIVRLGASAIFPEITDLEAIGARRASQLLSTAGLKVAGITHRAFGFAEPAEAKKQRTRLLKTIDMAQAVGAPAICMTTGGRGRLSWTDAAARFCDEIRPCAEAAASAGVALGIEPTSHLYADVSLVHRLSDVVALAKQANVSVGLDFFSCWVDADLEEAIIAAGPLCAFVQISDYVLGDRGLPCRAIPGDGVVPIEQIVGAIMATGYRGPFDIEVIGPRLFTVDRHAALLRGVTRLNSAIAAGLAAGSTGSQPS
jgi:sugar phosphate isomerase/epimerase